MNLNVIFRFIQFILKHPVNPDIYMDVVVENCSYIFDTSAIHGGRMQVLQEQKPVYPEISCKSCYLHGCSG